MTSNDRVSALLDDLEMQADGLYLDDRDREVEALAEAGYAEIALVARVAASAGLRLRVGLTDGTDVAGDLCGYGAGWLLLDAGEAVWLVPIAGVVLVEGLGPGSVPESSRPRTARLTIGSVLRRLAGDGGSCVLRLLGGRLVRGALLRVGADFVVVGSGEVEVTVPLGALVAVGGPR